MKSSVLVLTLLAGAALAAPPQEFSTSAGTLKITPIQHASLMIQAGGKVLYIDPAQGFGSENAVAACPDSQKRLLRFTGADVPSKSGMTFIDCVP